MEKETSFREVMLWVRLAMTFNVLYQEIKQELSKECITVPQLEIISSLDRTKGLSLSEIAERLNISPTTVVNRINRMIESGYIFARSITQDPVVVVREQSEDLSEYDPMCLGRIRNHIDVSGIKSK